MRPSHLLDDPSAPTTPYTPSPLARTDTLPLSSNHPHARKQSVLDGDFSVDTQSTTSSFPYTPTSSTSTFSLALDPIAEAALSPYPSTPAIGSPTIEPVSFPPPTPTNTHPPVNNNSVYAYPPPPPRHAHHRPAPIGLGQPSTSARAQLPHHPRTAFASTFPPSNTELILYSYAQLTGSVLITPVPGALPSAEQARTLNALRSGLLSRAVLGGGSMDITASLNPLSSPKPRQQLRAHSRSSSFSAGAALHPVAKRTRGRRREPGTESRWERTLARGGRRARHTRCTRRRRPVRRGLQAGSGSPSVGGSFGNAPVVAEISPEEPLPTFEVQPAMLAVDLALAPGESRSCMYMLSFFGDVYISS